MKFTYAILCVVLLTGCAGRTFRSEEHRYCEMAKLWAKHMELVGQDKVNKEQYGYYKNLCKGTSYYGE